MLRTSYEYEVHYIFRPFFSLSSNAQSDTLWPNLSASWTVETFHYDGIGGGIWKTFHYHQEADSIYLNSKYWHTFKSLSNTVGLISFTNQKVYFKCTQPFKITACCSNYSDTSEVLLYDFSGQVSDTVNFDYGGNPIKINQISDTLYDTAQRKVFYLSNGDIWIAGVGSVNGLFPLNMVEGFGFSNWICWFEGFYHDSLGLDYSLSKGDLSNCVATIEDQQQDEFYLLNDMLVANLTESNILKIYTITGQVILTELLNNGENTISLNSIPSGVYIVQVGNSKAQRIVLR